MGSFGVFGLSVVGLTGKPAQYCRMDLLILSFVLWLNVLPCCAAAILSFCACGMSFLYTLFMEHGLVRVIIKSGVIRTPPTINIVQNRKK